MRCVLTAIYFYDPSGIYFRLVQFPKKLAKRENVFLISLFHASQSFLALITRCRSLLDIDIQAENIRALYGALRNDNVCNQHYATDACFLRRVQQRYHNVCSQHYATDAFYYVIAYS